MLIEMYMYVNYNSIMRCTYIYNTKGKGGKMKQDYIEAITKHIQGCEDISLLDLILKMLEKEGW